MELTMNEWLDRPWELGEVVKECRRKERELQARSLYSGGETVNEELGCRVQRSRSSRDWLGDAELVRHRMKYVQLERDSVVSLVHQLMQVSGLTAVQWFIVDARYCWKKQQSYEAIAKMFRKDPDLLPGITHVDYNWVGNQAAIARRKMYSAAQLYDGYFGISSRDDGSI